MEISWFSGLFSTFDLSVGIVAFIVGAFVSRRASQTVGFGIFLNASLLIIKMTQYYFNTHPEAKSKVNDTIVGLLNQISKRQEDIHSRQQRILEKDNNQFGGPVG